LSVQTSPRLDATSAVVVEEGAQTEYTGVDTDNQTNGNLQNQEAESQTLPLAEIKDSADQTSKSESEKSQQTSKPESPETQTPAELAVVPTSEAQSQTSLNTTEEASQTSKDRSDSTSSPSGTEIVVATKVPAQSSTSSEEPLEVLVQTRVTLSDSENKSKKKNKKRKWVDDNTAGPVVSVDTRVISGSGLADDIKTEVTIDTRRFIDEERKLSLPSGEALVIAGVESPPIADHSPGPPNALDLELNRAADIVLDRISIVKGSKPPTPISDSLFVASVEGDNNPDSVHDILPLIEELDSAVASKDEISSQTKLIMTVETISDTLEIIEYRIVVSRRKGSEERVQDLEAILKDMQTVKEGVDKLDGIVAKTEVFGDSTQKVGKCLDILQSQVEEVQAAAEAERDIARNELSRWEEFLNGVNNVNVHIKENQSLLEGVLESESSTHLKLTELEKLEASNTLLKEESAKLIQLSKFFMEQNLPPETFNNLEQCKKLGSSIIMERERLLQLLSLADEYEQTLKEFAQIIEVAESLVSCEININSLPYLQEEMQKHRKFFVNLSHCRGILESLEENLDKETQSLHMELHERLHTKATVVLDAAAGRAQLMSLAASRWTVLEQGSREQQQWLQVAHQRLPDIHQVVTNDYPQYISLYQVRL